MDTVNFSCKINTNIPSNPIHLKILLDEYSVFDKYVIKEETVSFDFAEDNEEHTLRFLISGKTDLHTVKDNSGAILDSTQISITDISFDAVDITSIIMVSPLKYKHNFNNNGNDIVDKFYDIAGCNGEIILEFSTPIYLWLLENM